MPQSEAVLLWNGLHQLVNFILNQPHSFFTMWVNIYKFIVRMKHKWELTQLQIESLFPSRIVWVSIDSLIISTAGRIPHQALPLHLSSGVKDIHLHHPATYILYCELIWLNRKNSQEYLFWLRISEDFSHPGREVAELREWWWEQVADAVHIVEDQNIWWEGVKDHKAPGICL